MRSRLTAVYLGVAAACAAILLLGATASQAATGGLVYKVSKLRPLPAGEQASAKANCPNDTSVVGGGLQISEGNTATGMHSSFPFDDGDANAKPDDGWQSIANSRSAADKSLLAFAVCSKIGRFSYVVGGPQFGPDNSKIAAQAPCPAGQSVAGGGLALTQGGAETLYSAAGTHPIDLPSDADSITDDGWGAEAINSSGIGQAVTAYAICAKTGSYRYDEVERDAPAGAQTETRARCPKLASLTAGGVEARSIAGGNEVAAALPVDGGDSDMVPDDRWLGAINNNTLVNGTELWVYAVCRKLT
jgi:hypothetical protein